jgi:hypothetical protein
MKFSATGIDTNLEKNLHLTRQAERALKLLLEAKVFKVHSVSAAICYCAS